MTARRARAKALLGEEYVDRDRHAAIDRAWLDGSNAPGKAPRLASRYGGAVHGVCVHEHIHPPAHPHTYTHTHTPHSHPPLTHSLTTHRRPQGVSLL